MSPAVNAALSLLALALAVAAIVLATIANRRWARRPRAESPVRPSAPSSAPPPAESATLRSEVEALRSAGRGPGCAR